MKTKKNKLPSSVFCSLSDSGRAFTDMVTNATYFPKIDIAKDYENLIRFGGFPSEALPAVLHETVHHWCFMAPIGNALSMLKIRSQARMLQYVLEGHDDKAEQSLNDHTKYSAATELLRPLSEGMSLFAEFDVMPYVVTPVISKPMELIYFYFCRPDAMEIKEKSFVSLLTTLGKARCSNEFIRRKADVLLQPLLPDKGGYLPGYLTVKSLWIAAREKCNDFYDADLFYSFLRRYIYGDYGLVESMLSDAPSFGAWLSRFSEYLQERLDSLVKLDLKKEVKKFIASDLEPKPMSKGEMVYLTQSPPIGIKKKLQDKGRLDMENLLHSMTNISGDTGKTIRWLELQALVTRHLLWIGQTRVQLAFIDKNKVEILLDGKKIFEEVVLFRPKALPAYAQLDHYISVYQKFSASFITAGQKTIAIRIIGEITDEEREQFTNAMGDEREQIEKTQAMNEKIFKIFVDSVNAGKNLQKYIELTNDISKELYAYFAFTFARFPQILPVRPGMEKDGLLSLLNNDIDLLKKTAALSMGASLRMFPEEAMELITGDENMVLDILARLKEISERTGFPTVFGQKGSEMVSYV